MRHEIHSISSTVIRYFVRTWGIPPHFTSCKLWHTGLHDMTL